ncbi:MAG: hypothetical protein WA110_02385 [Anaerolineaceae bacterium]
MQADLFAGESRNKSCQSLLDLRKLLWMNFDKFILRITEGIVSLKSQPFDGKDQPLYDGQKKRFRKLETAIYGKGCENLWAKSG